MEWDDYVVVTSDWAGGVVGGCTVECSGGKGRECIFSSGVNCLWLLCVSIISLYGLITDGSTWLHRSVLFSAQWWQRITTHRDDELKLGTIAVGMWQHLVVFFSLHYRLTFHQTNNVSCAAALLFNNCKLFFIKFSGKDYYNTIKKPTPLNRDCTITGLSNFGFLNIIFPKSKTQEQKAIDFVICCNASCKHQNIQLIPTVEI